MKRFYPFLILVGGLFLTYTISKGQVPFPGGAGGGGGGGGKTSSTAIGSEPVPSSTGDLDFYTDAPFVARFNGTSWIPWGILNSFTTWVDSGFSWVNQGTSTIALNGNILVFTAQTGGSNLNSLRLRVQSTPGGAYTVTMFAILATGSSPANDSNELGLVWRDSSSSKLATCGFQQIGGVLNINGGHWTNETTFSAGIATSLNVLGQQVWLRIKDDGVNRTCAYSFAGNYPNNFVQFYSEARATFLTPNQYGYYMNSSNNLPATGYFVSILQN